MTYSPVLSSTSRGRAAGRRGLLEEETRPPARVARPVLLLIRRSRPSVAGAFSARAWILTGVSPVHRYRPHQKREQEVIATFPGSGPATSRASMPRPNFWIPRGVSDPEQKRHIFGTCSYRFMRGRGAAREPQAFLPRHPSTPTSSIRQGCEQGPVHKSHHNVSSPLIEKSGRGARHRASRQALQG